MTNMMLVPPSGIVIVEDHEPASFQKSPAQYRIIHHAKVSMVAVDIDKIEGT